MARVTVLARCTAKPGLADKVRDEILALVGPTRAEPGCINYDLHQSESDPTELMLYENWRSENDLDKHLKMPYLKAFLGKAEQLLAKPVEISTWQMVSKKA